MKMSVEFIEEDVNSLNLFSFFFLISEAIKLLFKVNYKVIQGVFCNHHYGAFGV